MNELTAIHLKSITRHLRKHLARIENDVRALEEQAEPEYRAFVSESMVQSTLHGIEYSIDEVSLVLSDMKPRLYELFQAEEGEPLGQ